MVKIGPDRSGSGGWNLDQSGVLKGLIWTNLDLRLAPVTSVLIGAVSSGELSPPAERILKRNSVTNSVKQENFDHSSVTLSVTSRTRRNKARGRKPGNRIS